MALVRIDDLSPAAALTGAEVLEIEQGGVSFRVTAQEIADLGSGTSSDAVTVVSISGGTATVDCALGANKDFTLLMTENATLSVNNLAGAGKVTQFEVEIKQDATGSRTLTLPASFRALGGSDTTIASSANSVTVLSAKTFDNGATWRYAMQESA